MSMQEDDVSERIHAVETAQAVQVATQAGAEATQTAMQVGAASTNDAAHAGTIAMIAAGSISLIVGMFLGLTIRTSK